MPHDVITFSQLESFSASLDRGVLLKQASNAQGKTVFLSHSHQDKKFLPGVIQVLQSEGGQVYVDHIDERLPRQTNRETADILRSTIRSCTRFVAFVTTNSKDSRWIPWELGLADGAKGEPTVALFPSAERAGDSTWTEQEYLGLYRRIDWGSINGFEKPGWRVLDHAKNQATWLKDWIAGRATQPPR
ncbi:MAG TPA: toll/interleukin-1 receptor domain-containing protein [Candidatus Thermoplasmatota archaeon]|nr:toll/interleukin-1 receptor domain-containing protein [Candidatus Thermoplasmatota archaeon]